MSQLPVLARHAAIPMGALAVAQRQLAEPTLGDKAAAEQAVVDLRRGTLAALAALDDDARAYAGPRPLPAWPQVGPTPLAPPALLEWVESAPSSAELTRVALDLLRWARDFDDAEARR